MVDPKVWGGDAWYLIHSFVQMFRQDQVDAYRQLLSDLQILLPCKVCCIDYYNHLLVYPVILVNSADTMRDWALKMHNATNQSIGAPQIPSYNLPGGCLDHGRVARFLDILFNDLKAATGERLKAAVRFRQNLSIIIPCGTCRARLAGGNKRFQDMISIIRSGH